MSSGPGSGHFRPRPGQPANAFGAPNQPQASPFQQPGSTPQQQVQDQQQQHQSFGNRPRPFSNKSFGGPGRGGGGVGGPPGQNVSLGRGVRPIKPFPANPSSSFASGSTNRPRPFTNRSTVFNKTDGESSTAAPGLGKTDGSAASTNNQASAFTAHQPQGSAFSPGSAFGSNLGSNTFGSQFRPASAFPSSSGSAFTSSAPPGPSPFGSIAVTSNAFDSQSAASKAFTPGFSGTSSSASVPMKPPLESSGTDTKQAASSPFNVSTTTANSISTNSAFGSSAAPPKLAPPMPSTSTAPPTAPASSFSSFLRKDRSGLPGSSAPTSGSSTPANGYSTPSATTHKGTDALDEDEQRKKRFEDAPKVGNRFLEMKGGREALRASYIKSGVLPDPDKPTDLALAVKLVGTCQDMCPEFEREEREFQKELDPLELYPGTDRVDPRLAVKIYRRPAAGRELPLPEDVRPPPVLKRTLDYLFHDLLPPYPNDPRFTQVQGFLWNRTRAVRQDFIVQSEGGPIAIECHERIARYHILCLHWRGGPGAEGWSEQQELEQLRKTLRSLIEFYDDRRRSGQSSPNEAEFRAYNLLLHLRDPETLREAELLPGVIFRSTSVQSALNLRHLAQRSNNIEKRGQPRNTEATLNFFSKFFSELKGSSVNYLMACLAENSFSSIRIGALKAMSKSYMNQHKAMPIETLQKMLGMDDAQQVVDMAQHLGIELDWEEQSGHRYPIGVKIDRTTIINEDKPLISPFSSTIVEAKRGTYTNADVVDGKASGAAAPLPSTVSGFSSTPQPAAASSAFQGQSGLAKLAGAPLSQAKTSPAQPLISQQQHGAKPQSTTLSAAAPSFTPSAFGNPASSAAATASPPSSFSFSQPPSTSSTLRPATERDTHQSLQAGQLKAAAPAPAATPASDRPTSALPSFTFGKAASEKVASPAARFSSRVPTSFPSLAAPKPVASTNAEKGEEGLPKAEFAKPTSASSIAEAEPKVSVAAAAASAQEAAQKKLEAAKRDALRKRAVQKACDSLISGFVANTTKRIATLAVEGEIQRRRAVSRDELVSSLTSRLLTKLVDEQCRSSAEQIARRAVAETFRFRSCTLTAIEEWKSALASKRDRERQRQRLEDLRNELRKRRVLSDVQMPDAASFSPSKNLLIGARAFAGQQRKLNRRHAEETDTEMRRAFVATTKKREHLWEEGSMLGKLADHMDELFLHFKPGDLERWTAIYDGANDHHVASSWLRMKFGLEERQSKNEAIEVDLTDGSRLELVDANVELDQATTGEEVGMVIFETSPLLVYAKSDEERRKLLESDRARLTTLANSPAVSQSILSVRLLVIVWGDPNTALSDSDSRDSSVLAQLGLTTSSLPFDRIRVLELSDASSSPELALSMMLEDLMVDIRLNERHRRRLTLQELCKPFYDLWIQSANLAADLLQGLPPIINEAGPQSSLKAEQDSIACKTLLILTALANHVLRTLLSVSDTILEEDEEMSILIPVPSNSDSSSDLKALALSQLDALPEEHGEESILLRSQIQSQSAGGTAQWNGSRSDPNPNPTTVLPINSHVATLFSLSLQRLEQVWIQVTDEQDATMETIQTQKETLENLSQRAVQEIADLVRSNWNAYRTMAASNGKADGKGQKGGLKRPATAPSGMLNYDADSDADALVDNGTVDMDVDVDEVLAHEGIARDHDTSFESYNSPAKRIKPTLAPSLKESLTQPLPKRSSISDLKALISRTRAFLDAKSSPSTL